MCGEMPCGGGGGGGASKPRDLERDACEIVSSGHEG